MAKVVKKPAPPPADMYKAFTSFKDDFSKKMSKELLRDVNNDRTKVPKELQLSYSQQGQCLRIIDTDANNGNGIMVTVKYNDYEESVNDYIDKAYIRPMKGAPSGIGMGWQFSEAIADGTRQSGVWCRELEEFRESLSIQDRNRYFVYGEYLMKFHCFGENNGIPCIHQDQYEYATPEMIAAYERMTGHKVDIEL